MGVNLLSNEERLLAMVDPKQQTWNLSPSDVNAIRWSLEMLSIRQQRLEECYRLMDILRIAIIDAKRDIFHWVAFAERQRAEIDNVDYLPCGPNEAGINESRLLMSRISAALASEG